MIVGAPLMGARIALHRPCDDRRGTPCGCPQCLHCLASARTAPHRSCHDRSRGTSCGCPHCGAMPALPRTAPHRSCHDRRGTSCGCPHCPATPRTALHRPASPRIAPHRASMLFAAGDHKSRPYDRCRAMGGDASIARHCPAAPPSAHHAPHRPYHDRRGTPCGCPQRPLCMPMSRIAPHRPALVCIAPQRPSWRSSPSLPAIPRIAPHCSVVEECLAKYTRLSAKRVVHQSQECRRYTYSFCVNYAFYPIFRRYFVDSRMGIDCAGRWIGRAARW